jgi:SpoVK/Ycf46/Vps4 family AAA+-type ATPase
LHRDGLRTAQGDRVLVLAATNRPADLDEAVVRRLPRRLLVDLPDAVNRARILKVTARLQELHCAAAYCLKRMCNRVSMLLPFFKRHTSSRRISSDAFKQEREM